MGKTLHFGGNQRPIKQSPSNVILNIYTVYWSHIVFKFNFHFFFSKKISISTYDIKQNCTFLIFSHFGHLIMFFCFVFFVFFLLMVFIKLYGKNSIFIFVTFVILCRI